MMKRVKVRGEQDSSLGIYTVKATWLMREVAVWSVLGVLVLFKTGKQGVGLSI